MKQKGTKYNFVCKVALAGTALLAFKATSAKTAYADATKDNTNKLSAQVTPKQTKTVTNKKSKLNIVEGKTTASTDDTTKAPTTPQKPDQTPTTKDTSTKTTDTTEDNTNVLQEANVDYLKGASVTASNAENNINVGSNAVDGKLNTRWATDITKSAELVAKIPNAAKIQRVELHWEQRYAGGQPDPNITAWTLYYADTKGSEAPVWKTAYKFSGTPSFDQVINLDKAIIANQFKLDITGIIPGKFNWANVSLREFEAYTNTKVSLNDITSLTIQNGHLVLPNVDGQVSVVGSTETNVIDLTGKVYTPLTAQNVKVMLSQKDANNSVTNKEFTVNVAGQYTDEGVGVLPAIVPVVQQWHGVAGTTTISNQSIIDAGDLVMQQMNIKQT